MSTKKAALWAAIIVLGVITFTTGWGFLTSPTYTSLDKSVTVVCGHGFFYDLSAKDADNTTEQTYKAEVIADLCTKDNNNRTSTDWKSRSKQIANQNICVINWELTPEAHKRA
ncbi:MAG: hypothetical protein FJ045_06395 [Crenarchaeota archaeon]|nr:hypothetical protein [Thermoproteota archaeon]